MGRGRPIVHDVSEKEQGVVFRLDSGDFFANHLHPFIEDLLEIVRRDLRADDIAVFDGIFYCFDKF